MTQQNNGEASHVDTYYIFIHIKYGGFDHWRIAVHVYLPYVF